MKIFVIGYGQAGGRIADVFVEYAQKTGMNFVGIFHLTGTSCHKKATTFARKEE